MLYFCSIQIFAALQSDRVTKKAQPHVSQSRIRDFFGRPTEQKSIASQAVMVPSPEKSRTDSRPSLADNGAAMTVVEDAEEPLSETQPAEDEAAENLRLSEAKEVATITQAQPASVKAPQPVNRKRSSGTLAATATRGKASSSKTKAAKRSTDQLPLDTFFK